MVDICCISCPTSSVLCLVSPDSSTVCFHLVNHLFSGWRPFLSQAISRAAIMHLHWPQCWCIGFVLVKGLFPLHSNVLYSTFFISFVSFFTRTSFFFPRPWTKQSGDWLLHVYYLLLCKSLTAHLVGGAKQKNVHSIFVVGFILHSQCSNSWCLWRLPYHCSSGAVHQCC